MIGCKKHIFKISPKRSRSCTFCMFSFMRSFVECKACENEKRVCVTEVREKTLQQNRVPERFTRSLLCVHSQSNWTKIVRVSGRNKNLLAAPKLGLPTINNRFMCDAHDFFLVNIINNNDERIRESWVCVGVV